MIRGAILGRHLRVRHGRRQIARRPALAAKINCNVSLLMLFQVIRSREFLPAYFTGELLTGDPAFIPDMSVEGRADFVTPATARADVNLRHIKKVLGFQGTARDEAFIVKRRVLLGSQVREVVRQAPCCKLERHIEPADRTGRAARVHLPRSNRRKDSESNLGYGALYETCR